MTLASETGPEGTGVLQAGVLELRPAEGLALASGRALRLSVREFGLLAELARARFIDLVLEGSSGFSSAGGRA